MFLPSYCCLPNSNCAAITRSSLVSPRTSLIFNVDIKPNLSTRISPSAKENDHHKKHGCVALRCGNHIGSGGDYDGAPVASVLPSNIGHDDVSNIITEALYEEMFPYRNDRRCPAKGFYTYQAFLTAARRFPAFGTTGTAEDRRRELAAFFGQTSHETRGGWRDAQGGGWRDAPGGRYVWGYCHIRQMNPPSDYCVDSEKWPAVPGQKYYGRGPIQLTFNWNYGQAGKALGLDLLSNPDLVATDAVVSFSAAIWFWMTPQDIKPSCHNVILGRWAPNEADMLVKRLPGYGILTNIINPGECGHGADRRVASRIAFYERYCNMLGVSPGDNLDCYDQCRF